MLMLQELTLNVKALAAYGTVEWCRTTVFLVSFFVFVQVILPGEVLPTHGTRERLLPRVRHYVPHQMLLPAKRLVAASFVALERPEPDVRLQVLHEVFLPLERLGTHVTGGETDSSRGCATQRAAVIS